MDKEFITYEQALALKELGYDEKTIGFYNSTYCMEEVLFGEFPEFVNRNNDFELVSAPLKQQVFRWFREKYELSSWIYNTNSDRYFYTILKNGRFVKDNQARTTYEEAENACIDKLIQLIKQQDNG